MMNINQALKVVLANVGCLVLGADQGVRFARPDPGDETRGPFQRVQISDSDSPIAAFSGIDVFVPVSDWRNIGLLAKLRDRDFQFLDGLKDNADLNTNEEFIESKTLGTGSFGTVFQCIQQTRIVGDEILRRPVAVKEFKRVFDYSILKEFEVNQVLADYPHPSIAKPIG